MDKNLERTALQKLAYEEGEPKVFINNMPTLYLVDVGSQIPYLSLGL